MIAKLAKQDHIMIDLVDDLAQKYHMQVQKYQMQQNEKKASIILVKASKEFLVRS